MKINKRIAFVRCGLFSVCRYSVFSFLSAIAVSGSSAMDASSLAPGPGWRVADLNGAPGLYRDGKPVPAILFWQWELKEQDVKAMSEGAGIGLYSCFGSFPHYANPYWTKEGFNGMKYQTDLLDKLVRWNPEAAFLPRLFAAAPQWWIDENPAEQIAYTNPKVTKPNFKGLSGSIPRESFASMKLRRELGPVYRSAVEHLMWRYGKRLMGIHVTNGPWGENFAWDGLTQIGGKPLSASGFGDASAPMTLAFREYLRKKYGTEEKLREAWRDGTATFENATVPGMEERLKFNGDGWRDPAEGRRVPDYFECMNAVTVEMLDHYGRIVKEASRGELATMAFYGYTQDEKWALECDHRAISKMYRLKNIDMFSAPHTYHRRKPGEDGEMRCYLASAALHGKFFIDEGDDMTHLERMKARPDRRAHAKDMFESVNLLYREFGNTVTHGVGLWYMDLTRNTFRHPELVAAVGRMRKAAEIAVTKDRSHVSEVALISNVESEFYMGYRRTKENSVSEKLYLRQMEAFYRCGAPFDWYLAEDLEAVRARKYKVVALLDCEYLTDAQYETLMAMKRDGVKFVFFHAPGYVSQTGLSWERVKALTGGEEYRELKMKTADELRGIYRDAGVHIYTEEDVVLSANKAWVSVHTKEDGEVAVKLPSKAAKVTDVTRDGAEWENTDEVKLRLRKYETSVLLVE